MRALVIDDDDVYRLLIGHTLTELGYEVDQANDGHMGSQLAQLTPYDLVVTDIVMPHQDGMTVIRLVSGQFPSTRIVAVSGGGRLKSVSYLGLARALGAHAVVAKPFLPAALAAAVAQAVATLADSHGPGDKDAGSPAAAPA